MVCEIEGKKEIEIERDGGTEKERKYNARLLELWKLSLKSIMVRYTSGADLRYVE